MNIEKLKRRLNRLKEQRDKLQKKHGGNELKCTYWGGYDLGYLKGKICEIEDILDELGVNVGVWKQGTVLSVENKL